MPNFLRRIELRGLRASLGITIGAVSLVLSILLIVSMTLVMRSQSQATMRERLATIVRLAALQVDGDSHAALRTMEDQGKTSYMTLQKKLREVREMDDEIAFVYTLRKGDDGNFYFVIDIGDDQGMILPLGSEYEDVGPDLAANYDTLTGPLVESQFNTDEWGTWLTGYMPIFTKTGQLDAVLAVDISADSVVQQGARFVRVAILATLLMAVLIGAAAFWLANSIAVPMGMIARSAERFAEGDFELEGVDVKYGLRFTERRDEIGEIARAFQRLMYYLREISADAQRIARGDLTGSFEVRGQGDRLGQSFNEMRSGLAGMTRRIHNSAQQLTRAAGSLTTTAEEAGNALVLIGETMQEVTRGAAAQADSSAKTAQSMAQLNGAIAGVAQGAQEQAMSVSMAATVTAEINDAVRMVTAHAASGAENARQAGAAALEGAQIVGQMVEGMRRIHARVDESTQKIHEMDQHSRQIGLIVETISDIADQTNLLAINAAIEAARAGEQGKGFAVVASEVRKLAERSAVSTKEVSALVRAIRQSTDGAVAALEESARESGEGLARGDQSGQALERIVFAVEDVTRRVEEISQAARAVIGAADTLVGAMDSVSAVVEENTAATEEMSASAAEVNDAVSLIARTSEENTAAVEEVSASADEIRDQVGQMVISFGMLSQMAQDLNTAAGQFQLGDQAAGEDE